MKRMMAVMAGVSFAAAVAIAGPDINWASQYGFTGIGAPDLLDASSNAIPQTSTWAVELIRADNSAVLFTASSGFWSAAAVDGVGFEIIPGATIGLDSWNGLSVRTRVWGSSVPGNPLTDLNGLSPASLLSWSAPVPPSIDLEIGPLGWVPEPGTGLLVLAGAAVAMFRRRRLQD